MKKIFGNIRTLAALLIASATLAACSTEDSVMTDEKAPQVYTLTIDASMDGGAQTRALEFEGTKLVAKWANDETVDVRRGATPLGTLTVSNVSADGKTCTLSGTLTGTINKEDGLNFHYNIASLVNESQTGTLSSTAASDYAMAAVTVKSVNGGNITLESEPSFQTQVAVLKITMQDALANKLNATSLKIKIGDKDLCTLSPSATAYTENGDGVVYFALPSAHRVYLIGSIGLDDAGLAAATVTFTATAGGDTYITTKTGYPFAAGKYYATTLTMTKQAAAPAGAEAVDLGLSVKWANMNLGATSVTDYGDFFAWAETEPYYSSQDPLTWKDGKTDGYADDWSSYKFGSSGSFTKYTGSDSKTTLEADDDAATANWGGDWRMPKKAELEELYKTSPYYTESDKIDGYSWEWQSDYQGSGHAGYLITVTKDCAQKGNSVFLPAAGRRDGTSLFNQGSYGIYWSSSRGGVDPNIAGYLGFGSDGAGMYDNIRYNGFSVRPVQGAAAPAVPTGALSGQFTINSSGDKVYFSKGNLQYIGSAATPYWQFAEHQYDYLGITTSQNSAPAPEPDPTNVDRDLFGWGTSGKTFASGYGSAYQPYATSYPNGSDYGPTDGTSGLTGTYADGDWGVNMGTGWRTLTKDEWKYVFGTNDGDKRLGATVDGTSNALYTEATINTDGTGVNGVILFPDGATFAAGEATWGTINAAIAWGWGTQCTTAQWTALEAKGCVFLPAAGLRSGTSVQMAGSEGGYWSSTAKDTGNAYRVSFYSGYVEPADYSGRYVGWSVRLVREVE